MQDKYGNSVGGYVAGTATGGSATTLQDVTKNFSNDMFINKIVVFEVKGIQYSRVVIDNDANTLTFASAHAAEAAVCKIQVGGSIITVTAATAGEAGNANLAKVIEGSGDDALAAALSGQVLTVSLGMTDGASDDAENTATLVAAAIDGLAGFAATVTTGDGSDVVVVTPSGAYYRFSGGLNAMPVGTEYQIQQPEGSNVQLSGSNLKGATVATVTTAGTRVQLPTLACSKVTIIAKRANTGYIYVGMNTVSATVYGAELAAKDAMDFEVSNLSELWIDSSVSLEGISYVAI